MKFNFVALVIIFLFFLLFSCKKNDVAKSPVTVNSTTIMGFKDSTQLVKSFLENDYDSSGNFVDSGGFYFYYDTINKKIIISSQFTPSSSIANYVVALSYNNNGLLTHEKYNPEFTQDTSATSTIDYIYDAQNVLSSQTITNNDGSIETVNLNKTNNSSGGYSLTCKSSQTYFVHDSILNTYEFDAMGKLILKSDLYLPYSTGGGYIDSLEYDVSGNISKVIETSLEDPSMPTYTLFEFSSRDTKGIQLSNFNKILYNGISNFADGEINISLGGLLNGYDDDYFYQFTNYPALNTKVYQQYSNSYVTFNPNPQYDSQGRLVKYRMYNGDGSYYYTDFILTYYK